MDLTNFWFSSGATGGGGGGGDQGQPIGESLRFRGAEELTRTFGNPTNRQRWTWSAWVKLSGIPDNAQLRNVFFSGNGSNSETGWLDLGQEETAPNTQNSFLFWTTSGTTGSSQPAVYRDFSAWYNIVFTYDGADLTCFVNGEPSFQSALTGDRGINGPWLHSIGNTAAASGGGTRFFEGYMADVYFIDGQVLDPTAFGRYNDNDIWVPIEVDFTPATMRFSDFVFTDLVNTGATATPNLNSTNRTGFGAADPPENMFDGSETTRCSVTGAQGSWLIWRPETPLENVTNVRVFTEQQNMNQIWMNGANSTFTNPGSGSNSWFDLGAPANDTLSNIAIQGRAASGQVAICYAVEVTQNGVTTTLTNPFIYSGNLTGGTESTYQADVADRTGNVTNRTDAFDGNLNSSAFNNVQSDFLYFNPTSPIPNINTLFYRTAGTIGETRVNGNVVTITSTGTGTRWVEINNPPNTLEELAFTCSDGFSQLCAVGINGTDAENILVDGVNNSSAPTVPLKFEDPDNLGLDTSGNNNNFTATGFNTTRLESLLTS